MLSSHFETLILVGAENLPPQISYLFIYYRATRRKHLRLLWLLFLLSSSIWIATKFLLVDQSFHRTSSHQQYVLPRIGHPSARVSTLPFRPVWKENKKLIFQKKILSKCFCQMKCTPGDRGGLDLGVGHHLDKSEDLKAHSKHQLGLGILL